MADGRRTFGADRPRSASLGSGLAALSGGKPWAAPDSQAGATLVDHTGGHVPLAGALGLVALACWGVVLVTRARVTTSGRRPGRRRRRGAGRHGGARPLHGTRLRPRRDGRPRQRGHLRPRHRMVVGGPGRLRPGARRVGGRRAVLRVLARDGQPVRRARDEAADRRTSTTSTCGAPSTRATIRRTRPATRMRLANRRPNDGPIHEERCMSDNHGNTPAAWAAVAVAMLGFVVGGIGLMFDPVNLRCSGWASPSASSRSWCSW